MSITAKDLFCFINEFRKVQNTRDEITAYFLADQLQKTKTETCGIFQLYFQEVLFAPVYNSTIISNAKLM